MKVSELLAALDADFSELREVAEYFGISAIDLPSNVARTHALITGAAEARSGDLALHELVESALPERAVRRLLRQPWNGRRGSYRLRPNCHIDATDRGIRRLAAQLATAWNSPGMLDARMSEGRARELFRPVEHVDEAHSSKGEDLDQTGARELHEPQWWTDTYFQVSPDGELPEGLSRVERALFPHQDTSIQRLKEWWSSPDDPAGVLCLPTGGGKTRTTVKFVLSEAIGRGRVLWLTHREELMNQAIGTFLESAADADRPYTLGRFARGNLKVQAPVDVLVGSIPTLARKRAEKLHYLEQVLRQQGGFRLVIVDECHHGVARGWKRLLQELQSRCKEMKLLGLSATPTRGAEHERPAFWRLFGRMIHEAHLVDLIKQRVLASPKVETVDTGFEIRANMGEKANFEHFNDLPPSLVTRICRDEGRNNKVVSVFAEREEEWGSTLIFAATVEQGRFITRRLRELGVRAEQVYGNTPAPKRKDVVERFRKGDIRVVVNVGLFTEGTDIPGVQTVFMARPTRSKILFRQMVGRGLRGPEIGGSDECCVVSFFDEVSGLVKESLASSFQDEHEAMLALGIGETLSEAPDDREQLDEESPEQDLDEIGSMVIELRQLVRANVVANGSSTTASLRGWWEAVRGRRRAFVPVFDDVAESINRFVRELPREVDATIAEELSLPVAVLNRFMWIANRPGVEPKYVDLDEASPEAVRAVLDEVAAANTSASEVDELAWIDRSEGHGDDAEERFAVLVDGQFEEVQTENLWRLRNEWNHYAVEFGLQERPELAPDLARLLLSKADRIGLDEADSMAILDAAADSREFPSVRRITPRANVPALVKALSRTERDEWNTLIDRAWKNGLSFQFESKTEALLAAIRETAKAA